MNLDVKRLTPKIAEDYFDFFDNRAFSDNSPYYPCYCNAFNMSAERIRSEVIEQANANDKGSCYRFGEFSPDELPVFVLE